MAVAGGQIDQAALRQQIQNSAVGQLVAHDVVAALEDPHGHLLQLRAVDLHVEMAGVGEEGVVLHDTEMAGGDDIAAAGGGDEDVTLRRSFVHGHDAAAVHGGLQGLDGVDFRHDDVGAHALGAHGNAPAAVAVARHHHGLARHQQVGGVHDGVPDGLAGAVFVVIVVLALGVIDVHHGEGQLSLPGAGIEPVDAGSRFLRAADDIFAQMGIISAQEV